MGVQREHLKTSHWREDETCSYCGSLSPEAFFRAIDQGCELGPTDKNYKVYVDRPNPIAGKPRIVGSANHKPDYGEWIYLTAENIDTVCAGFDERDLEYARRWNLNHWVQVGHHSPRNQDKFYFQHLDPAERQRFIELLNAKVLKIGYPGHFYVLPFFAKRIS